jgi:hypothetical protein
MPPPLFSGSVVIVVPFLDPLPIIHSRTGIDGRFHKNVACARAHASWQWRPYPLHFRNTVITCATNASS